MLTAFWVLGGLGCSLSKQKIRLKRENPHRFSRNFFRRFGLMMFGFFRRPKMLPLSVAGFVYSRLLGTIDFQETTAWYKCIWLAGSV